MKRAYFGRVTACVALCVLAVVAGVCSAPASAVEVRESYIVLAQDNSAALTISNAMSGDGLHVTSTQLGAVDFVEVMLTATQAATWSRFTGVRNIEVNQKVVTAVDQSIPPPSGGDWTTAGNWGLDRIDQASTPLDARYNYTTTGAGVDIYIIDTGIRRSHSEFAPASTRVAAGYYSPGLSSTDDGCGHGTHVAGIAAGATFGVAKGARIIPVRVFPGGSLAICNAGTTISAVVAGVNWVTSNHTGANTAVANMSLGATNGYSASLEAAVLALQADGVSVVVAAGNDGAYIGNASYVTPACTDGTISVGATRRDNQEASFSNYGDCVNIMAPGYDIKSAWPAVPTDPTNPVSGTGVASDSAWALLSGTSMAAPFVAGAVARLLETSRTATPVAIANQILSKATVGAVSMVHGSASAGTQSPNLLLYTCGIICYASAPTLVSASASSGAVAITWSRPDSDGGSAITGYIATANPGALTCAVDATGHSCTINNLVNGTTYSVSVSASNSLGTGIPSTEIQVVPAAPPFAPSAPSAVAGDGAATVTWVAPVNGGSAITSYTATAVPGGATCTTTELSCTVKGLQNLSPYTFTVIATNAVGASATSPASSAVTPSATWVTNPEFVSAVPGNKVVVLTWSVGVLSSGTPTGYVVKTSDGVEVCRTTEVTCTVGGLANGSTPTFSVEALGATATAASQAIPKVVVGGLLQKSVVLKAKSKLLLTRIASTLSKGKTTWNRSGGSCAVSGKYLVAASRKGSCVFRVSVAKKAPFAAQKLTVRLQVS
ncbi:MAG: S8 family serine peptidase [Actinomycetes bacterium]